MKSTDRFLPYGRHFIDDEDRAAVLRVLESDWLTTGPAVGEFENGLKNLIGVPHASVCANGTAALHLAALALNLGPGDVAIVPTLTFLATANAVRLAGADVMFADVDPETGLMTPDTLKAALSHAGDANVRAVFNVHLNGQVGDCAGIARVAGDAGLPLVEDACHALGTTYADDDGGRLTVGACAHSDAAVFSFHPVKTIAMGEGGALTTQDAGLAERVARLRNHGMIRDASRFENGVLAFAADGAANPWYYEMPEVGLNYRASDINCALGTSQLRKFEKFSAARHELARRYDELLPPLAPLVRPIARTPCCDPVWHLYVVLIDFKALGLPRATVMNRLRERGIGTQVHYLPVHHQPYYRRLCGHVLLPGADAYYDRCLSIPCFPGMTGDDVAHVVENRADICCGKSSDRV